LRGGLLVDWLGQAVHIIADKGHCYMPMR
ncbi:MAG: hypothetical protein ACI8PG_005218, partial [Planctomycetota bacterium]